MHLDSWRLVSTLFAENVYINILLELFKEILALLHVNFVGYDDCQSNCIKIMIPDLEVRF